MSDMEKAVEGGAEFTANQQAQAAAAAEAEKARAAAVTAGYPRVNGSGGASDDLWVYPSAFPLEYDTEAEAVAAAEQAHAEGRYVSPDGVVPSGNGYTVTIELDPSTRYSTSDHTGGR